MIENPPHADLKTDSTSSVRLMCMAAAAASAAEETPLPPPLRVATGSDEAAAAAADDEMKTDACRPMSVLHSCEIEKRNQNNERK